MTDTCDVEGCTQSAIATLHRTDPGQRCRDCLLFDLDAREVTG